MNTNSENFPKTVGSWTRPDSAQLVDASNIFDYMNGAGELYLAYRFDHLEVYEYTSEQQEPILAEVYVMKTPADAYGLLSLDWTGEPVIFSSSSDLQADAAAVAPAVRALYGEGLLRLCAETLYARIMAYRETPEAREAVLALGEAITANRQPPAEPEFLKILPQTIGSDWTLLNDRIGYFRSYLVLNSFYYLSHQNILNLDHTTEAVTAPYEHSSDAEISNRPQLLCVKYATPQQAQEALNLFHESYLPEHPKGIEANMTEKQSAFFKIEDGWLGYALEGMCLSVVFECPHQESARLIVEQISCDTISD